MNVVIQSLWHLVPCRQRLVFADPPSGGRDTAASDNQERGEEDEDEAVGGDAEHGLCRALQDVFAGLSGHHDPSETTDKGVHVVDVEVTLTSRSTLSIFDWC